MSAIVNVVSVTAVMHSFLWTFNIQSQLQNIAQMIRQMTSTHTSHFQPPFAHLFSPREIFDLHLPHPKSIWNWYATVDSNAATQMSAWRQNTHVLRHLAIH